MNYRRILAAFSKPTNQGGVSMTKEEFEKALHPTYKKGANHE